MRLRDRTQHRAPELLIRNQCHAEGGATKGGRKQMRANANKRRQTLTNASKRKQTQRRKRKQTQANASKHGQTQTNAYTPPLLRFFTPPFAIPLRKHGWVQKCTGLQVPWKTGMLIYLPVTSRPPTLLVAERSERVRPRQGTDICNLGRRLHWIVLNFLQWIVFLFLPFPV